MNDQLQSKIIQSRGLSTISGVLLSILWGFFAYTHLAMFIKTGNITMLLIVIAEALAAFFYLVRTDPKSVSLVPFDWLVAVFGTFLPLFFRPSTSSVLPLATMLVITGVIMQILAMASLNRSFALVAAQRNIKTNMMYRFIRHPIYASYCLTFTGYILTNSSLMNFLVYLSFVTLLLFRIVREEDHLSKDSAYRAYKEQVRYRLIPFIF